MLRIDVDGGEPYGIPQDNPFAAGGGRPETFALGLRNPWRFSFDRESGELYAGDVGQNAIEEVDIVERGGNYGWRLMEGRACYEPSSGCERPDLIMPITQYEHGGGRCSVTGGYVYRGSAAPELAGAYVFGDYCSGEMLIWRDGQQSLLVDTDMEISSFGEDAAGELYVVDLDGTVYRLEAAAAQGG
jgi:glucose/arabinose dehydrogenase